MESMGVANGRGKQEVDVVSGWNLWVWLVSVVVRRYTDSSITATPYIERPIIISPFTS